MVNERLHAQAELKENLDKASERFMYIMEKRGHIVERKLVETHGDLKGVLFIVVEDEKHD